MKPWIRPQCRWRIRNRHGFHEQITVIATGVILLNIWDLCIHDFHEDILLSGPSALILEKEEDYDCLVQFDSVDHLSGDGVDVYMVDSGIDMSHGDLSELNLAIGQILLETKEAHDDNGHGTMMAIILVADGELTGLAKDVNLYVASTIWQWRRE